ncbi:mitochondrial import receptor subunit TOM20 homolog [Mytilus edulis]|uniref:mitochondrial import receptor subunit TOM20 homolog n=1 Tax=Mytilus edulis TaxID=6550 RepID=UPI0039EE6CBA
MHVICMLFFYWAYQCSYVLNVLLYFQLPDLSSPEAMQKFFLQEVQIGEDLLAQGEIEEGVEHLSVAVAVCGQPQHLLQVLQQTLPPQVFQLLIQKLPTVNQRLSLSKGPTIKNLEEDDVE